MCIDNFAMKTLVILALFLGTAYSDYGQPFCKLCSCKGDEQKPEVYCAQNIKDYLFDTYYWFNSAANVSYAYEKVQVQFSSLVTLDKKFPANTGIKVLNLGNNSLVNISDSVFCNLQDMEELILSDNKIEVLHPLAFNGLYLEGDFMPLKSLKILRLDHNRIHTLDADIFEHTGRVEVLSLSHNPFKMIDQQTQIAITSLVNLKDLDLSHTGISSLADGFMHTPRYITRLDLSGNLFQGIPQGLGDSHALETLIMDGNPIVNLTTKNGFPVITTLKVLHMCNMPELRNVSEHSMSNLLNLEELHLADNPQLIFVDDSALNEHVDGAVYPTWPPIKKLHMQNNKLTYLDQNLLLDWNHLSELDLTGNPWTCECENQWMIDELMTIYLKIDEFNAKLLRCAAPIEMIELSFYDVYEKKSTMRCLDMYGHRPERDGVLLIGLLAGILVTIPLVLLLIYAYQRNWFGFCDKSPASFSRQFYRRTQSNEEYF